MKCSRNTGRLAHQGYCMFEQKEGSRHSPLAGFKIGIVVLNSNHCLLPGNVQNAVSFDFPVLYEVIDVPFANLMAGDSQIDQPLQDAIERLQARRVSAIVGACGSFAQWQSRVRRYAKVPVYLSIMAQVPFALLGLPFNQKLGIVFADAKAFNARVCDECLISAKDQTRVVAFGATEIGDFGNFFISGKLEDSKQLERDLVALLQTKKRQNPEIGAWLFQCSEFPPYAAAVQRATKLPVYDMVLLINHLYHLVSRQPYL